MGQTLSWEGMRWFDLAISATGYNECHVVQKSVNASENQRVLGHYCTICGCHVSSGPLWNLWFLVPQCILVIPMDHIKHEWNNSLFSGCCCELGSRLDSRCIRKHHVCRSTYVEYSVFLPRLFSASASEVKVECQCVLCVDFELSGGCSFSLVWQRV